MSRVSPREIQLSQMTMGFSAVWIELQRARICLTRLARHSFGLVSEALLDRDIRLDSRIERRRGNRLTFRQDEPQSRERPIGGALRIVDAGEHEIGLRT